MTPGGAPIDTSRVKVGRTYDMTIAFGSQRRTKCQACTCYLSVNGSENVTCGRCGTVYVKATNGRFKVVSLP